jgi:hypothetical protein
MLLVNEPIPEPSEVFASAIVGLAVVPQHTPRAVTAALPSEAISPPDDADVPDIPVTAVVLTEGGSVLSFLHEENGMAIITASAR